MSEDRIAGLIAKFDGLIKYTPMLQDHPDWTDEQCIAFAKKWHDYAVWQHDVSPSIWNQGVPYCRNIWREEKA